MDFDGLVASVCPPALLADVTGILIGMRFTDVVTSQAWDLLGGGFVVGLVVVRRRLVVGGNSKLIPPTA